MRRFFYLKMFLSIILVLCVLACMTSCGKAPKLEEVEDRFKSLIEASYELNDIFWGDGLPTYERGGEFDKEHMLYDGESGEYILYEYVTSDSKYLMVDTIKAAAEQVYSKNYLNGVYTMLFDGYADDNNGGNLVTARYLENQDWLLKYIDSEINSFNLLKEAGHRRYDMESMRIVRPSTAKYVNVEIDSYLLEDENEKMTVRLRFVLQDGEWFLDSPTY